MMSLSMMSLSQEVHEKVEEFARRVASSGSDPEKHVRHTHTHTHTTSDHHYREVSTVLYCVCIYTCI